MLNPENSISLISVNTEGHRHIDRLLPFLRERQPEVVLLQDCFERTSNMVAESLGIEPAFVAQRQRELYFDHGPVEVCVIATISISPLFR